MGVLCEEHGRLKVEADGLRAAVQPGLRKMPLGVSYETLVASGQSASSGALLTPSTSQWANFQASVDSAARQTSAIRECSEWSEPRACISAVAAHDVVHYSAAPEPLLATVNTRTNTEISNKHVDISKAFAVVDSLGAVDAAELAVMHLDFDLISEYSLEQEEAENCVPDESPADGTALAINESFPKERSFSVSSLPDIEDG